ncbi:sterol O-acyltransferase 2 [Rhinatrema bivittatum]|uniref:sterol O-acyltransferase 2 n=1 Tax=Rhinatrema bivittatum TaxID=194408 RepID=UPI001127DAA4|nr:sterol O-acyltransferase 2 [Rhinatrema bivittatum]
MEESSRIRQRKNENKELCDITNGNSDSLLGVSNLACWKKQMKVSNQNTLVGLQQDCPDLVLRTCSQMVKSELLDHRHLQMNDALDRAVQETAEADSQHPKGQSTKELENQNQQHARFLEKKKVFVERQSLLDELMETGHFRMIYHVFIAIFCVFIIGSVAADLIDQGSHRSVLEFDLLFFAFGKFQTVVFTWLCMFSCTLLVPFKALHLWGGWFPTTRFPRLFSATVAGLLIVCQTCMLGLYPAYMVIMHKLPPVSSIIITLEQFRLIMKSYSFLREKVPQIIQLNLNKEKEVMLPKFSSYLYFLFCPTMIYRDSYPRTPFIRWKYVIIKFVQLLGGIFYIYFILVTLCIPTFSNMSKQPFSAKALVLSIFHATLPGTLVLLVSFFCFLHCWLNAFAEMLRFADRMFYQDWWNSTSFANYYRTWNVVIHDWLYYYVYQDLMWLLNKKCRAMAMLAVFLMSAAVHEYVFTLSLGYFYPVMFCLFAIFGVIFNFMLSDKRKNPVYNVIVWTCLIIGQGIQISLYCQEWFARIHCPLQEKTFWGLVTPRSWSCHLQE